MLFFNYTRIFLITSPYRSFLVVIFFPLSRNPMIIRIGPKKPNQLSVESENAVSVDELSVIRVDISTP